MASQLHAAWILWTARADRVSRIADSSHWACFSVADCALLNSGRQTIGPARAMADMIARAARRMPDPSSRHFPWARRQTNPNLASIVVALVRWARARPTAH